MSNYAACSYWIVLLTTLIFLRTPEAGDVKDWNRVFYTFDDESDPCSKLPENPAFEAKDAADNFCKQSFEALDRVKQNYCSGWRLPECRKLPEYDFPVCSCIFSSYTLYGVKINGLSSFRDCAWDLYKEEYHTGRTPAPSANFKRKHEKIYDDAKEKSRRGKAARTSHEAGPSNASRVPLLKSISIITKELQGSSNNRVTAPPQFEESQNTDLRCPVCKEPFCRSGNLKYHIKKFHSKPGETGSGSVVSGGTTADVTGDPYVCDICGKGYKARTSLASHKALHTKDIRCRTCDRKFSNKPNYRRHMENNHPELLKIEEAEEKAREIVEKPHACTVCRARFRTPKVLKEHQAIHRGETYCQQCNQLFGRKSALMMHIKRAHTNNGSG